ncbi:uncharacterized protein LOC142563816 [Dermacentor variabilis]|uniref:uncharacterized protein LOC142563816 n=1 Tax=Dermacentor variabilis TaxID=34621 RepID=UPI003F5BF5D4
MTLSKIVTSRITVLIILAVFLRFTFGGKLSQTTEPVKGCPKVTGSFSFMPHNTSLLGRYCALGNGEKIENTTETDPRWIGSLTFNGTCRVCCARGGASTSTTYSVINKLPRNICKKRNSVKKQSFGRRSEGTGF